MSEILMGGEKSGTPMETRGGTSDLAAFYQNLLKGGPAAFGDMFGRMSTEGMVNMLGFDPATLGMDEAAMSALMDPANSTAGLFRSMRPFEEQQMNDAVSGVRQSFGTLGGRFSRNAVEGESRVRGEVGAQQQRTREGSLMQAQGQRTQALLGILGAANAARQQAFAQSFAPWELMHRFFQPGAPVMSGGILPGLLNLGGTILGMKMFGQQPTPGAGGQTPGQMPGGGAYGGWGSPYDPRLMGGGRP